MDMTTWLIAGFLSIAPISELRGAIPYALANGIPVAAAFGFCVAMNCFASLLYYFFLVTLHRLFYRIGLYRKIFDKFIEKTRKKVGPKIEKYGAAGLAVFVAIPLPVTGAITGTVGGWILGIEKRKLFPSVFAGVFIAGVIVTLISYFGIEAFSFFTKEV